jgi:hypothetical protein
LKKLLVIFLLFGTFKAYSQANFSRIAIGVGAGVTTAYTGLTYGLSPIIPGFNPVKGFSLNKSKYYAGSLDYYFTPFITAGIEYNSVELKDGTDKYNRAFVANLTSIEVKGTVAVGQFIDFSYSPFLYNLRNFNASLGLGFISGKNNVADFGSGLFPSRQHANDFGKSTYSGVVSVPAAIGYNLNIYDAYQEVRLVLGVNYKINFTFSDDIDGYNDNPAMFENNSNDVYTTLGVSIKYLFGPKGLYFK